MIELDMSSNIKSVKGIGPSRAKLLYNLGIISVEDALMYFPRDYLDMSPLNFKQGSPDKIGAFPCIVTGACVGKRAQSGLYYAKVPVSDGHNTGYAIFFNQPYICKSIYKGNRLLLIGKIKKVSGEYEFQSPQWMKFDNVLPPDVDPITPVYSLTKGLSQKILRQTVKYILENINYIEDFLPGDIVKRHRLMSLNEAIRNLHFPKSFSDLDSARYRIIFDELLLFQLMAGLSKRQLTQENRKNFYDCLDLSEFISSLPFSLTLGQNRVINDILGDLKRDRTMYRLVQGDVGSGKTVVACSALYFAAKNRLQSVMMAPTEILASQHFETLTALFKPFNIKVELLKGATPVKARENILSDIREGFIDVVVGTHALLGEDVEFPRLGLVITDEQHRFGVNQRKSLEKKGQHPDVLVMSATPIPRTIAMVLYSDLDISVIDTLPSGRQKVETYVVNTGMRKRAYDFMVREIKNGKLAFVVCPAVEDNELDVTNVEDLTKSLRVSFPEIPIGMLHGKMAPKEKDNIVSQFIKKEVKVLVSTTVVEVGVDVSEASIMIVEDAERFGLSQLHQLRGRVGRGEHKSYCILISDSEKENAKTRLKYLTQCYDGFEIAQRDLDMRGPGEFLGVKQHGFFEFKMAGFVKDSKTLKVTKELSDLILEKGLLALSEYERLNNRLK